MADLSHVSGARLEVLHALLPHLYVTELIATGDVSDCAAAIDRLRRDPRVRSVEADTRRDRFPVLRLIAPSTHGVVTAEDS